MVNILMWLDALKLLGIFFALCTVSWILFLVLKYRDKFIEAVLGDDGRPQFLELLMVIWTSLFVSMIIADFSFGLTASERAWWGMDSTFLVCVGGRAAAIISLKKDKAKVESKTEEP